MKDEDPIKALEKEVALQKGIADGQVRAANALAARVTELEEEIHSLRNDLATSAVRVTALGEENQRLRDLVKETLQAKIDEKTKLWEWINHFPEGKDCLTCEEIYKAWRGE